jgi:cellulose synthase/poly-beta-1,6-N-acetylglucosamine synthase-like glycosyltransferase
MNRAVGLASSEILCFNDANTTLSTDALAHLLNEFHDETVALVSGAKHVTSAAAGADQSVATGDGAYWRYESAIRRQESLLGATVSVVGEILAIRAADWTDIPDGVVNDDAWIAMRMLSDRRNVRYAPRAESWELATPSTPLEVARRRRINAGRLRLIMRRDAWPLTRPFVLLAFLSHKVLRLLLPFLFTVSFVTSVVLATGEDGSTASALIAALHVAALLFAGLHIVLRPLGLRWKLASVAFHVLSAYASVLLAHYDVARGKQHVLWSKQAR